MLAGRPACCMFTGFIFAKETHFQMTLKSGSRLICVVYKFNLTGGLTLSLDLICLLLLFDCLRSNLSVCVL